MTLPTRPVMERAYLERDASYDGVFFTAVRTTKIFCRPTCPARKPFPKNVDFFQTSKAAIFAGYRACKRCRPLEDHGGPGWVSMLLAELEHNPNTRIKDADLKARGIDPTTVRRYFLRTHGLSFQSFARANRLAFAQRRIQSGIDLDTVILESGYESHSGFREAFARAFGKTPGSVQVFLSKD